MKNNCTLFPEGNWSNCCKQHDEDYSEGSGVSRKDADKKLRECIKEGDRAYIVPLVYAGVRLFGWLRYKR